MKKIFLIILSLAAMAGAGMADSLNVRTVGNCSTGTTSFCFSINGNYAYAATDHDGLRVIDIASPNNPSEIGYWDLPDWNIAYGVAAKGNYAYVAAHDSGLVAVNISNPTNPTETSRIKSIGTAKRVAISGNYAFVAATTSGLRVIDISDSTNLVEAGFCVTGGACVNVFILDTLAYVAESDSGLRIINIANPNAPYAIGLYNLSVAALTVFVKDSLAYLGASDDSLRVINIFDPSNPTFVTSYKTMSTIEDIYVKDKFAYLANVGAGLTVLDVSNPMSITEAGFYNTTGYARSVFLHDGYIDVLCDGYFNILKGYNLLSLVSAPTLITPVNNYTSVINNPDFYWHISDSATTYRLQISPFSSFASLTLDTTTSDTFLTSSALPNNWYYWRVKAYNATDSSEWSEVRSFSVATSTVGIPTLNFPPADTSTNDSFPNYDWSDVTGATQYELQVGRGYRWILASYYYGYVQSYNVSDPAQPEYCGSGNGGNATDVGIKDTFALVASNQSIYVVNIADPSSLKYQTWTSIGTGQLNGIVLRDTLAYVADWSYGLRIVNVKDPFAMTVVGSYDSPGSPRGLALNGNYVYLADANAGLTVIDVSDPANPVLAGQLDTPGDAQAVAVSGNYAYVADNTGGMRVINISNPSSPVEAGSFASSNAVGVTISGNLAYLADGAYGLRIISVANPASPIEFGHHDSTGFNNDYRKVLLDDTLAYVADYNAGLWVINVKDPYQPRTVSRYNNQYYRALALLDSFAPVKIDSVVTASQCEPDTFLPDGIYYWRARAGAGAWGDFSVPRRLVMDTNPPGPCWFSEPWNNQLTNDNTPPFAVYDQYHAEYFQVQVASDTLFAAIEVDTTMKVDSFQYTTYYELQTPLTDGWHYFRVRGGDLAQNWSAWCSPVLLKIDTQAPPAPTGITANGGNPSPWTKNNLFSINFTAPYDTSGVVSYYYKIGSVPTSGYDTTGYGYTNTKPFSVNTFSDGITPIYVWAKDNASNLDCGNSAITQLRYDHIPPQGSSARSNEFSRNTTFNIEWNAGSDLGGSGLSGSYWIKYKVNSGGWTDLDVNYAGTAYPFTGVNGNKYYFEVAAWDSAGNSEAFTGAAECSTMVDNTINFPVLVSPYNGVSIDTTQTDFLWQKVPGYTGARLQCSYNSSFTALAKDTILPSDSVCALSLSDSLYYWRAQGYDSPTDTSSWAPYRSFRVDTQAPSAPYLAEPANDTLSNDNTPLFVWKEVAGAAQYRLELSTDSNFAVKLKDVIVDTADYIIDITLPDSIYYWRVRAGDAAGNWSAASEKWHFTIDTKAPAVPALILPGNSANLNTNLPVFTWNRSDQAVSYQYQASKSTGFETTEYDTLLTDSTYTPLWGLNDGTHYWRVRCRDLAGNWSAYSGYRAVNIAGILQVVGVFPGNGNTWPAGQSVWIQFTKPIYTGYIDTTHIKIRGKRSSIVRQTFTWQAASRTLMVSPDSSFAANDTVSLFLHGSLRDSANVSTLDGNYSGTATGDSSDSYLMSFYTTQIGDYDTNRVINSVDLALFAWAWIQPTYYRMFEAGPLVGTWPHQKIYIGSSSSNRIDFEDLAGFIYSWNRSDGTKNAKSPAAENGPVTLESSTNGKGITVTARMSREIPFVSMDAEIGYDETVFNLSAIESSTLWQEVGYPKLFLSKQQEGRIILSAAKWNGTSAGMPEMFSISFKGSKTITPITLNYRLFGEKGQELASGSTELSLNSAPELPVRFYLSQAAPNPANRPVTISYQLPKQAMVRLDIYNIAGQRVATLAEGVKEAGYYNQTWDLKDQSKRQVTNGIYFYKLVAGDFNSTGKVVVIK